MDQRIINFFRDAWEESSYEFWKELRMKNAKNQEFRKEEEKKIFTCEDIIERCGACHYGYSLHDLKVLRLFSPEDSSINLIIRLCDECYMDSKKGKDLMQEIDVNSILNKKKSFLTDKELNDSFHIISDCINCQATILYEKLFEEGRLTDSSYTSTQRLDIYFELIRELKRRVRALILPEDL